MSRTISDFFSEMFEKGRRKAELKACFDKYERLTVNHAYLKGLRLTADDLMFVLPSGKNVGLCLLEQGALSNNIGRGKGDVTLPSATYTREFSILENRAGIAEAFVARNTKFISPFEALVQKFKVHTGDLDLDAGRVLKEGVADFMALPEAAQILFFKTHKITADDKKILLAGLKRVHLVEAYDNYISHPNGTNGIERVIDPKTAVMAYECLSDKVKKATDPLQHKPAAHKTLDC